FDFGGCAAHRRGELVFAAETDTHLDRSVGALVVVGTSDREFAGGLTPLEHPPDGWHRAGIEHADVDQHVFGSVLERPLEKRFDRSVGTFLQQVAFGNDDCDAFGKWRVGPADSGGEIPVVQSHMLNITAMSLKDTNRGRVLTLEVIGWFCRGCPAMTDSVSGNNYSNESTTPPRDSHMPPQPTALLTHSLRSFIAVLIPRTPIRARCSQSFAHERERAPPRPNRTATATEPHRSRPHRRGRRLRER